MFTHTSTQVSSHVSRRGFLQRSAAMAGMVALARVPLLRGASNGYQIGCYTRPWDQFDYRVALDGMAEAGYKYAGLMTHKGKSWVIVTTDTTPEEAAAMGEEVRRRGLELISIYVGNFPVQKSVEAGIEGLKRLIDNCAAARCSRVMVSGTDKPELVEPYFKVVSECCDYAAAKKMSLSVKPHGGSNATAAQCRKIIEMVGKKNFGMWYDPGNIFFYSGGKIDPVNDVPDAHGLIAGMSIKDFKPPKEVMVTPGTGQVNFREVLARAKKGGFKRGPLIVECLDRGDSAAKITAEARKTREFLETLVRG
ncbi:MAG TPA: sugar phosphate isomerase/epimerase family protein [Bryobacteraceae bacterium]|nr:sugar phosphate isomerase/epimerase family protein [Bryobacteraceae bacterium]